MKPSGLLRVQFNSERVGNEDVTMDEKQQKMREHAYGFWKARAGAMGPHDEHWRRA
jgi:hypothetical protein